MFGKLLKFEYFVITRRYIVENELCTWLKLNSLKVQPVP